MGVLATRAMEPVGGAARRHSSTCAGLLCTPHVAKPVARPTRSQNLRARYRLTLEVDGQPIECEAQVLESKLREG